MLARGTTSILLHLCCVVVALLAGVLEAAKTERKYKHTDDLEISGAFRNSFGAVINGANTPMVFNITNSGSEKYTLTHMGGAFVTPSNSSHVTRQLKPFMYDVSVAPSTTVTVPYHLHPVFESEEKFEMGLILVLYFTDASKNFYQSVAYDGIITIHEPELSIFDPQVLSIYAFCLAMVGGIIYWVKESYFAPVAGKKAKVSRLSRTEVEASTAEMKLDHDWIPEHHLKPKMPSSTKRRKA